MNDEKETSPRPKKLLVFAHRQGDDKGKIYNLFYEVTSEQLAKGTKPNKTQLCLYHRTSKAMKGSGLKTPAAGMVYEVEYDENSIFPGTAAFETTWPDKDQRMEWEAKDYAEKRRIDAVQYERKLQKEDLLLEALEPVRRAYKQLKGPQRVQLLAAVVKHLTAT
jgi:hypothetical protein